MGLAACTATQTNEGDAKGRVNYGTKPQRCISDGRRAMPVLVQRVPWLWPGGRAPSLVAVHGMQVHWSRRRAQEDETSGGRSRGGGLRLPACQWPVQ